MHTNTQNLDSTIDFVKGLPPDLRLELAAFIYSKVIGAIPFFKGKPKEIVAFVGSLLRTVRFNKGQYLFKEGKPV